MAAFRSRPHPTSADSGYEITDNGNSNMKVVVRIRPENEAEEATGSPPVLRTLDHHVLVFDPQPENLPTFHALQKPLNPFRKRAAFLGRKYKDLRFAFDRVFDKGATQLEVFEESTRDIVEGVLDGVNCSVFAYGATGAGKTHTMLGTPESPGVMFHTMMELYRRITQLKDEKSFEVAVSYCEVYNESIRDLLASSLDGGSLELREDSHHGLVVSNLSKHQPKAAEEILSMLERGNMNRTQHPTDANATSSRSHAVFQVYVHQKPRTASITAQMTCAKLSLIDLAGSERATVTTNRGARLREGANINRSLLALGNCINALAENKGKSVHVPYRNSKLTRLLKDSLGGNCRTVMIANVSPSGLSYEDSYNTLKYADRAKQIKTKVVRNVLNVDFHVTRYRTIVQELQKEIAELKAKLETKTPNKKAVDTTEVTRLQDMAKGVYGERSRLRKHMVDLDTRERETLLRVCRKERDIHRIDALTKNEPKKQKLAAKVTGLQQQIVEIEKQKQLLHEYLYSNNESIGRVQKEIKASTGTSSPLRDLMREVVERNKLETENAHHWRQTKHLLRYIKSQEKEIGKTERVLLLALEVARRQHTLLTAHNALTASLKDMYSSLVRMAEGEKGVAWADQSSDSLPDVSLSSLSLTQQALFDTFLVHASPARRLSLDKHSPASLVRPGILTGILSNRNDPPTRRNEPAMSDTSSMLSNRLQLPVIPDKPRMPTPIDDSSSSCSSNSTYSTRLNTVLNSYHPKPSPAIIRAGRVSRRPSVRCRTPEPYLTPRPAHLLRQLQNTDKPSASSDQATSTSVACSTPSRQTGVAVTSMAVSSSSTSAFTPVSSKSTGTSASVSFTRLFSETSKQRVVPIPVPTPVPPPRKPPQSPPPPPLPPTSQPWDQFEDNFVSSPMDTTSPRHTSLTTQHSLTTQSSSQVQVHHSPEPPVPSQPSATPSFSSSTNPRPTVLCKPFPSSSPVLTVQTHSTVVSLHPTSGTLPSAHHSITVGLSQSHEEEESRTRPGPPAFIPPPAFNAVHKHSHTMSSTTTAAITTTRDPQTSAQSQTKKNSKQTAMSEPALNSTFTVPNAKSHHRLLSIPCAPSSRQGGGKHEQGALSTLHVNAPKALEDRVRGNGNADHSGMKKVPSYLQLTKSAASKRVLKVQNKENGTMTGHKRLKGVRSNGLPSRGPAIPQAVW